MNLANTLSRAFSSGMAEHQVLEQIMMTKFVSISETRFIALRLATETDESLQALKKTVMRGRPADKTELDQRMTPFNT